MKTTDLRSISCTKGCGDFFGLRYSIKDKYKTVKLLVVDKHLWAVQFANFRLYIQQKADVVDTLPSFTFKRSKKGKYCCKIKGAYVWEGR